MLFHVDRLRADVRGVRRWLIAVAVASFFSSAVTSYLAAFGLADVYSGTLSARPPAAPLSFLRVVDPDGSIVTTVTDGRGSSRLDEPGPSVLLERMGTDERLFLALPLGAFMGNPASFSAPATAGRVIVGRAPAFLQGVSTSPTIPQLWGSVPRGLSGLSDERLGPVALERRSSDPLERDYVAGSGLRMQTGHEPLIVLPPAAARTLGVSPTYSVSELVAAVTCDCTASDLRPLAEAMTRADRAGGGRRVYYALPYEGLVGPVERSNTASEVLDVTFAVGTLLGVCAFAAMAVSLFWSRRQHDYGVERRAGAGELALQVRQQVIVLVGVTLPVWVGFLLVDRLARADMALPWPPSGGPFALVAVAALQGVLGLATLVHVHRLCSRQGHG